MHFLEDGEFFVAAAACVESPTYSAQLTSCSILCTESNITVALMCALSLSPLLKNLTQALAHRRRKAARMLALQLLLAAG